MVIAMDSLTIFAYKGMDEDTLFHEPLRHHYNGFRTEGNTVYGYVCRGALMLMAHESDEEAETYVLLCGSCSRRVEEIEGHSISHFLDKVSVDPTNDGQMIGKSGYTGYLTPDYLRWCGYPASLLERVRERGPQYVWKK